MRAVILNDTSFRNHHGCRLVIRNLRKALELRDISVIATSYVGHDWRQNKPFLGKLQDCDLLIINGEGTLHHGAEKAELLLSIVDHPFAMDKKKVLLNALYEENPDAWLRYLSAFDIIGLRDHESWLYCQEKGLDHALETSDLSLYFETQDQTTPAPRAGIAISDSIVKAKRKALFSFYKTQRHKKAVYMPIVTGSKYGGNAQGLFQKLDGLRYRVKLGLKKMLDRHVVYYPNYAAYLNAMRERSLYVTGRFHGVCLALKTRTPFVTLTSNSRKTQSLLERIGLNNRIVENLSEENILSKNWDFSEDELTKISDFIEQAQHQWDDLFDRIKSLDKDNSELP